MKHKLKELELTSRLLEPTAGERKAVRKKVISYSEDFLKHIEKIKTYENKADKGIALLDSPISEHPVNIDEALNLIKKNVDT